jgi:P-type Cu+ transporter
VEGKQVLVGKRLLLAEREVEGLGELDDRAEELQREGRTVVYVAVDGRFVGIMAISDPIKKSTAEAIRSLHALGLSVIMLTGDNERTARGVAEQLGIDDFAAGVLPEEKHGRVVQLQKEGRKVAMAGDGINDAPALAAADVGIAMGTGTDVAMESAGVTLVRGDLRGIVKGVQAESRDDAQHSAESVLRLRLQRLGTSDRRGRAVSDLRESTAQPDDRRRGDELQFSVGNRQRLTTAIQVMLRSSQVVRI